MANGYNILWEHLRPVLDAERHRICGLLDFPVTASVASHREGHGYLSLLKNAWSQEVAIHFDAGWTAEGHSVLLFDNAGFTSDQHSIVMYVYGGPDFDVEGPVLDWPLKAEPAYYEVLAAQVAIKMSEFIAKNRTGIVQRISTL